MLKSDLEELKREHPDGLEVQTGSCRFCGQMAQIETLLPWPQEKLDEAATELCGCAAAQNYASRKKRMEKAKCTVERQFGKYLPKTAVELLKTAVELIEEDQIDSLTLDVGNGLKGKISMTSKGNIKIEKTETRKETQET